MSISIIYYNKGVSKIKQRFDNYNVRRLFKITYKILGITIGICIMTGHFSVIAYASGIDKSLAKADQMGRSIWKILLSIGYWVCAIYASKDMIADMASSDIKEIVKTAIKYLVGYALIFFFIDMLDLIRSFGG